MSDNLSQPKKQGVKRKHEEASSGMQSEEELTDTEALKRKIAALEKANLDHINKLKKADGQLKKANDKLKKANAKIEAKDGKLKKANAIIEAKDGKLKKVNAENAALKKEKKKANAKIGELEKGTIGWLINPRDEDIILELTKDFGASDSWHSHTKHAKADSSEAHFELDAITYYNDKVENMPSAILADTRQSTEYSNEASVQCYVGAILRDAVAYVNWVLSKTKSGFRLKAIPETSIFSNIPDHIVVYMEDPFKIPIVCVEVKKPAANPSDVFTSRSVGGQILDYLMVAKFMNGSDSFGVLTTFNDSKVVWLNNQSCNRLATRKNRLQQQNLVKLCKKVKAQRDKNLANNDDTPGSLPDAQALAAVASPKSTTAGGNKIWRCKSATPPSLSNEKPSISRDIKTSVQTYKPNQLFSVFCNAIIASLQAGYKKRKIFKDFEQKGILEEGQLVLHLWKKTGNERAYNWHQLEETIEIKGEWNFTAEQTNFFVVEHLGHGSTSRAWRAVVVRPSDNENQEENKQKTGYACVIKYWIKDHDLENGEPLAPEDIDEEASKTTDEEVKNYQTIYKCFKTRTGPLVGRVELNSRWCTILPFFHPLRKEERNNQTLKEIKDLLMDKFYDGRTSYQFRESDQCWRHVGKFKGEVVLFDLADLDKQKMTKENHEIYVDRHIKVLEARME